jgi:hypothetical protein
VRATESPRTVRRAYTGTATGLGIGPGARLNDAYQEANLSVAKRRLYLSAVRLAGVLGEAFREDR